MTPETLLEFEARWPSHTPTKDAAIRDELSISPARYYQLMLRAASHPEGIAAHPMTARLVRERQARSHRSRAERLVGAA